MYYSAGITERIAFDAVNNSFDPETGTFNLGETPAAEENPPGNPAITSGRVLDAVTRGGVPNSAIEAALVRVSR